MHLVKEIYTSNRFIQIYSLNPDLLVDVDASLFDGMPDHDIQDVVFNQIGADQVDISDRDLPGSHVRSYAVI